MSKPERRMRRLAEQLHGAFMVSARGVPYALFCVRLGEVLQEDVNLSVCWFGRSRIYRCWLNCRAWDRQERLGDVRTDRDVRDLLARTRMQMWNRY